MNKNDKGIGEESVASKGKQSLLEKGVEHAIWTISRYASEEDRLAKRVYSKADCIKLFATDEQFSTINANILVNAGINAVWTLVAGTGGTKFDNTNAYLGVGDSSTAAAATQTDLQAATNKTRKAMNASYPTYGTSQKVTYQSDFGSLDANYAWNEFAVFNASTAGTMLNRKVSSQGTKTSGQTWTLSLEITLS